MSGPFDELARNLATSMPRRRALRLLGGAIVVAAVPGLRTGSAGARGFACQPGTEVCTNGKGSTVCMPTGGTCCIFPDIIVGCRPGYTCGPNRNNACLCKGGQDAKGNCIDCPNDRQCGSNCCEKGEFCAHEKRGKCCKDRHQFCGVLPKPGSGPGGGASICCPPGTNCCANDKRADCCKPGQKCVSGQCSCPSGTKKCGTDCCSKNEICSNGVCCPKNRKNCGDGTCCGANGSTCQGDKCCPKGKVNCDGRCCGKYDCCADKTCCDGPSRACVNGKCCPLDRGVGGGKGARCCPPGTVGGVGGTCCPENDPECCSEDGLAVLCQKGSFCVRGTCKKL